MFKECISQFSKSIKTTHTLSGNVKSQISHPREGTPQKVKRNPSSTRLSSPLHLFLYTGKETDNRGDDRLVLERAGEVALGEVVLDGALLGSWGLGEGNGSTEWASEGGVLELGNADT